MTDSSKSKKSSSNKLLVERRIMITAIVTPEFKTQTIADYESQIQSIDTLLEQLQSLAESNNDSDPNTQYQITNEIQTKTNEKNLLNEQLTILKSKHDGESFNVSVVNGQSSLNVGDDIRKKLGFVEVVIKDYKITDIRNAPLPSA